MAISNPPAYLQAGTYPAALDRLHQISARFVPTALNTSDTACRSGVLPGQGARAFAFSMTTWDVTVGKGVGVVENTFGSQPGDYSVINLQNQTLTVTASSPTTNRIDVIGVRVQDAFYTGVVNSADLAIVQGTPSAGAPAVPALPASFLPIVQVTVNAASTTGVLTDLRKRTGLAGAVYAPFTAQLSDAGTVVGEMQIIPATAPYPMRLRVWDGSAWKGVTPYSFDTPAQSGSGALASGAEMILASLSVPDPGFSYKLRVNGSAAWTIPTATSPNLLIAAGTTLDSTALSSGQIQRGYQTSASIGSNFTQPTAHVATDSTAAQTGAHTLRLIVHNFAGIAFSIPAAADDTVLSAEMVPA